LNSETMRKNVRKVTKKLLKSGLMLALLLLPSGCATSPSESVTPDYPPEFLEKVADQYDTRTYGAETAKVVDDWSVMIQ